MLSCVWGIGGPCTLGSIARYIYTLFNVIVVCVELCRLSTAVWSRKLYRVTVSGSPAFYLTYTVYLLLLTRSFVTVASNERARTQAKGRGEEVVYTSHLFFSQLEQACCQRAARFPPARLVSYSPPSSPRPPSVLREAAGTVPGPATGSTAPYQGP